MSCVLDRYLPNERILHSISCRFERLHAVVFELRIIQDKAFGCVSNIRKGDYRRDLRMLCQRYPHLLSWLSKEHEHVLPLYNIINTVFIHCYYELFLRTGTY